MARRRLSREQLEDRVAELEEQNADLQSQLDDIADIVTPDDESNDQD